MPCRNCKYYDENETSGAKGYCDYIGIYVYPDDRTCSHYVKTDSSSGGCFVTTACCEHYGLPDDCLQLTMMRTLRDRYMRYTDEGRRMIDEYYKTAPRIVEKLNASSNQDEVYSYIYTCLNDCVSLVKNEQDEEAMRAYYHMFEEVRNKLS